MQIDFTKYFSSESEKFFRESILMYLILINVNFFFFNCIEQFTKKKKDLKPSQLCQTSTTQFILSKDWSGQKSTTD